MKIQENIVKGWITSIIGITTMIVTIVLLLQKAIHFTWDGVAGLGIGCILLLAPQTIEEKVGDIIKYFGGKSPLQ